ncbi:MAG: energy-coupling factor transporter ATPase [Lachnospiraceae bacterium]|nr:energy-coupling factor transporter ATPase [Lachnospiraceae bacterium]
MSGIEVKNLHHTICEYDDEGNIYEKEYALNGIDLTINEGEFVAIVGHNGSGKSTFAKHLNGLLLPSTGDVIVNGMNTKDEAKIYDIRQYAGMVFQNPDNQIIGTIVEEDVGFGPENIGLPTDEIWKRVDEALALVNMTEFRHKSPSKLSGGQKQRVAIAGTLAMKPKCIVLDEPTAMLDPTGRAEVMATLKKINEEEKVTIVLITHHMDEVTAAKRCVVLNDGKKYFDGTPREFFENVENVKKIGLDVPQVTEISHKLNKNLDFVNKNPLFIREFVDNFVEKSKNKPIVVDNSVEMVEKSPFEKEKIVEIQKISYVYNDASKYKTTAINNISMDIYKGEILGIIGHTGSGKSTLIQHLNGLIRADKGQIFYKGKNIYDKDFKMSELRKHVGLVFQYPEYQLFESTVLEDVCFGPKNMGADNESALKMAKRALKMMGIDESYYEKSPIELSGGEKRRVAIAGVIAMEPEILILDEPTAGLDPKGRDELLNNIRRFRDEENMTIIIVSHSMEDMANLAERIIVMHNGCIEYNDTPQNIFKEYKNLEKIGLAAPQVTYLMNEIKQRGIDVKCDIINVDDAVCELEKYLQ